MKTRRKTNLVLCDIGVQQETFCCLCETRKLFLEEWVGSVSTGWFPVGMELDLQGPGLPALVLRPAGTIGPATGLAVLSQLLTVASLDSDSPEPVWSCSRFLPFRSQNLDPK